MKEVRLLGVNARDYGPDPRGAAEDQRRLQEALSTAVANGDTIYLVRDPEQMGSNTDKYGRELAWLYLGDEPWYFAEEMLPNG